MPDYLAQFLRRAGGPGWFVHAPDHAAVMAAGDPIGALKRVALRDDAPALALRGIAMAQLGDLPRAKALLKSAARAFGKAIELRPGFVDAHVGRGLTLEAAGDFAGARDAYETAWRMRPDPALAAAVARVTARLGP